MNKTGLKRDGAAFMLAGATLLAILSTFPLIIAATKPSHEWSIFLVGAPAISMMFAATTFCLIYALGFLTYCSSKGYSIWVGIWLLLCNVPGLMILLLLPDLRELSNTPYVGLQGVSKKLSHTN